VRQRRKLTAESPKLGAKKGNRSRAEGKARRKESVDRLITPPPPSFLEVLILMRKKLFVFIQI